MGKADPEEVGRNDVDQIGNNERQARGISNEARCHDEGKRRFGPISQRSQHGDDDGRQDQRGAIIGEQR